VSGFGSWVIGVGLLSGFAAAHRCNPLDLSEQLLSLQELGSGVGMQQRFAAVIDNDGY